MPATISSWNFEVDRISWLPFDNEIAVWKDLRHDTGDIGPATLPDG